MSSPIGLLLLDVRSKRQGNTQEKVYFRDGWSSLLLTSDSDDQPFTI
jgi:hypothetical protein